MSLILPKRLYGVTAHPKERRLRKVEKEKTACPIKGEAQQE